MRHLRAPRARGPQSSTAPFSSSSTWVKRLAISCTRRVSSSTWVGPASSSSTQVRSTPRDAASTPSYGLSSTSRRGSISSARANSVRRASPLDRKRTPRSRNALMPSRAHTVPTRCGSRAVAASNAPTVVPRVDRFLEKVGNVVACILGAQRALGFERHPGGRLRCDCRRAIQGAACGLQLIADQSGQHGLAGAVRPEHRPLFAVVRLPAEVAQGTAARADAVTPSPARAMRRERSCNENPSPIGYCPGWRSRDKGVVRGIAGSMMQDTEREQECAALHDFGLAVQLLGGAQGATPADAPRVGALGGSAVPQ
jgi:hypothetical protein